jgi:hypothetical protein
METTILLLVGIAFFAGIIGGLVMAEAFDLEEPREKRRRQRNARRLQRNARNW